LQIAVQASGEGGDLPDGLTGAGRDLPPDARGVARQWHAAAPQHGHATGMPGRDFPFVGTTFWSADQRSLSSQYAW